MASSSGASVPNKAAYLSPQDLDGDDVGDDEGWAVGAHWWAGIGSERVEEVNEGIKALEGLSDLRPEEAKVGTPLMNADSFAVCQTDTRIPPACSWISRSSFENV